MQIYSSPFQYVPADPDMVSLQRESLSRLEYIDILYAGYDGSAHKCSIVARFFFRATKNTTAALYVEGVPPIMNGLRVEYSARDGIYFYEPAGPILLANSTVARNRGHGIAVDNTTDGRFFVNMTRIADNYGDGIWYRQKHSGITLVQSTVPGSRKLLS